ncbi:MAG: class I SAM-dependent methyltransferase [Candidatus Methanoperedens sp.]|nr:class I SAM-dependent methyltransferase [Candidatus Methanoperedens sp.]MCZ7370642.1 class I SAM-dependent methyltransferase [Candidatus Methanoperedens sp.]
MKTLQNKSYEREFFRGVLEEPTEYDKEYFDYLRKVLIKYIPKIKYKKYKVLEAGCGIGIFGKFLLNLNPNLKITGVDITPEMVKLANEPPTQNYHAITNDLEDENIFDKDQFELILCPFILHHFPLIDKVFYNLSEWIKHDGFLIIIEPNGSNPVNKLFGLMRVYLTSIFGKDYIINHRLATPNEVAHSVNTYMYILKKLNYNILFIDTNHFQMNNVKSLSISRLILYEIKNSLYKILVLCLPKLMRGSRIVIIAKKIKNGCIL